MDDTVYRKDVIDTMEKIMADHPIDGYEDECLLINAMKSLPSAHPEPCEDAVSRAKINAFCHIIIKRDPDGDNDIVKAFEAFRAYVNSLPSVTPKPRTGKWIDTGSGQECNQCHEIQYGYDSCRYFCANCGADMRQRGEQDDI